MVLFALSCFGLLLFLWVVFGGPTPLRAKGYRITAAVSQAGQLAEQAEVRISGVRVGKVESIATNPRTGLSDIGIEIDRRYAPIPKDTRLILRSKTLLGETYVELSPGTPNRPPLRDGGRLTRASIAPSVQLDEIIGSFDAPTRRAFQVWQQQLAVTGAGRGRDISDALAQLAPLEEQATSLLTILNRQAPQLTSLISGTGRVFAAISARDGQLRSLVQNSARVFATTAARNRELSATFVAFPAFQRETRKLLTRLHTFVNSTQPLVTQLTPAFHELSTTLVDLKALAPHLRGLVTGVGTAEAAGVRGLPATSRFLNDLTPFLGALDPALANLNPVLQYIGAYPNELTSFFANSVASTQATNDAGGIKRHGLRTANPLSPENLAAYPVRLASNRSNAYTFPNATLKLSELLTPTGGPPVFRSSSCSTGIRPKLSPDAAATIGQTLYDNINKFVFLGDPANVPAPRCIQQAPFTASGRTSSFPQIFQNVTPPPLTFGP